MTATLPPDSAPAPPAIDSENAPEQSDRIPESPAESAEPSAETPPVPASAKPAPAKPPAKPAPTKPAPAKPAKPAAAGELRQGFAFRLFVLAALPLLAFAALALQVASTATVGVNTPDDPSYATTLLVGLALALAAAAIGAVWLDRALSRRLDALARALRAHDLGGLRDLVGARGWGGTRRIASAVREAVAGVHEDQGAGEQLKALQEAADDLTERVRTWSRTEIAPGLEPAEADPESIAALRESLRSLAAHLEERRREALESARMAREVIDQACGEIARTGMETGRTAREIASLASRLGELKRLTSQLGGEPRHSSSARTPNEKSEEARWSQEVRRAERALQGLSGVREAVERIERASVRAALEAVASNAAANGGSKPALDLVLALRQAVVDCRHAQESLESSESDLAGAITAAHRAAVDWARASAATSATAAPPDERELVEAVRRIEHWANEVAGRIERLSSVAERLTKQSQSAWASARAGSEDLAGVIRRLADTDEAPAATPAPDTEALPDAGTPEEGRA